MCVTAPCTAYSPLIRAFILVRYNALSRVFESALQKEGIPSRILGGHRFFERLEVSGVLFGSVEYADVTIIAGQRSPGISTGHR